MPCTLQCQFIIVILENELDVVDFTMDLPKTKFQEIFFFHALN
jgi:hypothetical protein